MKSEKNTSDLTAYLLERKKKQRFLLILVESCWLICFLLLNSFLNSLLSIILPQAISLVICFWANKKLSRPKLDPPTDFVFSAIVPFGGGLVLDIVIMLAVIYKLVADNAIQDVAVVMTLCQGLLFALFAVLIWAHGRPDQLQYIWYAIAYFLAVILEWANTAKFNPLSPFNIDLEFSMPYFILPLKEAMLLYIILDVALQAFLKKYGAGNKESET